MKHISVTTGELNNLNRDGSVVIENEGVGKVLIAKHNIQEIRG